VFSILTEAPHEAIFFEDLKARNFEMFDRFKDVTKEHVFIVMKALAKMHAVFLCIKDQQPELVQHFVGREDFFLLLTVRSGKSLLSAWFEGQKKIAVKALEKIECSEVRRKVKDFLNTNLDDMLNEVVGKNVAEPHSTMCHGDVWNNNMMFRNDQVS
jgi:hypothetical protein